MKRVIAIAVLMLATTSSAMAYSWSDRTQESLDRAQSASDRYRDQSNWDRLINRL